MTLKYMQGFETMRDDSDLRVQGWSGATPQRCGFTPSISGVAGYSLQTIGAGNAVAGAPGTAAATDPGYFNTGVTINQAWLSGGFTLGVLGRINSGVANSYGAGSTVNCNQICFDGANYWAIKATGATYNVATSPDLKTWTVTIAQPTSLGTSSSIFYLGGGVVGVYGAAAASTALPVFYTNNMGNSWSSQSLGTIANANSGGIGIATGNATYPHLVYAFYSGAVLSVGTLGGTMTTVATGGVNVGSVPRVRSIGGLLVVAAAGSAAGVVMSATASNSALNTTAAWTTASFTGPTVISDIAYNPTSNLWVISSSSGIHTFPNTGAVGTPVSPSGSLTLTARYTTAGMQNVWMAGSTMVAIGLQGHIITSPDGVTWTEAGQHLLTVGTSGIDWRASIYDGTKYVLCSDATTGMIATTPDLLTNYQAQYIMDSARGAASNNYGVFGLYSGTAPSSSGIWSCNNNYMGLNQSAVSSGVVTSGVSNFGTNFATFPVSVATTFTHYYEFVATPTAGTANSFNIAVYLDGILVASYTGVPMAASTTDTTSLAIIVLSRRNDFVAYDDMYFCINDGVGVSGQQGQINIIARRPTTDIQAQWTKVGSAASNALTVNQPAASSQSANYLTSSTQGDKDIYTSSTAIPVGYSAKAIQLEAVVSRTSLTAPTVNIGLISGSTESDSGNVSIGPTATYISQVYQTDPNGNKAWTNSAILAAEMVANHVS